MPTSSNKPALAARLLGVAIVTLRRWTLSHHIPCVRTRGGHRRFKHDDLFAQSEQGITLLYARVSSRDQKEDLQCQVDVLKKHAAINQWNNIFSIQDIGSGLNTKTGKLRFG